MQKYCFTSQNLRQNVFNALLTKQNKTSPVTIYTIKTGPYLSIHFFVELIDEDLFNGKTYEYPLKILILKQQ